MPKRFPIVYAVLPDSMDVYKRMHTLIYICVNSFWNILKPIFNSNSSVTILEKFLA